eukprot:CAMPEP_0196660386 /NCGR_PEP_ID=MMETSP1086-20130531/39515_1 /TAXON_ID=77921 /ORGANISM="Cyanoptyche  gloeocystis , Strain SAG4.97" /LENGTH=47 /DNA_ID= /DNA_START= /DNA_END= /DNA_ORIENTATION=
MANFEFTSALVGRQVAQERVTERAKEKRAVVKFVHLADERNGGPGVL